MKITVSSALLALTLALGVTAAPTQAAVTKLPAPAAGAEVYPRPADGAYDISGRGFGHGIGMSQYGANGAAMKGLDHDEILQHYYPGTRLTTAAAGPITVGLTVDDDGVVEVAARPGLAVAPGPGARAKTLPKGRDRWRVRATSSSSSSCVLQGYRSGKWKTEKITGLRACPVTFSAPEGSVDVILPGGTRTVYRGQVTAVHRGTKSLLTVNRVEREQYLWSVVSAETISSFRGAAQRAQAVAARTYAARGVNGTAHYDTCDTTACQVYKGRGKRNADGSITSYEYSMPVAAVGGSANQVLRDGGGRLITTMYSSSNGGRMAGVSGFSYLASKADPYDRVAGNSRHTWTGQLPVSALESRFGLARLERVQIVQRDGGGKWGGRVLTARVEGYDASGAYKGVTATGAQLQAVHRYPTFRDDGLSSNYFTIDPEPTVSAAVRLGGANRYETAAKVSARWSPGLDVVYLASGREFPDALVAAARSGVNDGPVLITGADRLPDRVRAELVRLRPERVVALGGASRVSPAVLSEVRSLTTTKSAQRIAGANRYATAAELARYYARGPETVYLASGEQFPDALSVAALAGQQGNALLLTHQGSLPSVTRDALTRLRPERVVIVGGPAAVSESVVDSVRPLTTSSTVARWAGANRYETAAEIARRSPASRGVWVASGQDFPDALVGAARAAQEGHPLVLTRSTAVPASTRGAVRDRAASAMVVLGGTASVSGPTFDHLRSLLR